MTRRTVAELLDELGLAIGQAGVEIVDFSEAESCYIHHSRAPVAVAGYGLVSPSFARGRLPEFSFLDLVAKRPAMDTTEVCALAAICGAEVTPPFWGNGAPFGKQVWFIIEKYGLGGLFERLEPNQAYGSGGDHYLLRPVGSDDDKEGPIIKRWRADYKKLSVVRQLMTASIIRLYNSNENRWLVRVPKKWHAVEGIGILEASNALSDWARLYALYPGW